MSQLRVSGIATTAGTQKLNVANMSSTGYYTRQIINEIDTTGRTVGTTLALMYTGTNRTDFKAGSLIRIWYHLPLRNDDAGWGGAFILPEISYNNSTWFGLGNSGYDGNVMEGTSSSIASYDNTILVNPALDGITTDFSVKVRFWARAYSGTLIWNDSHGFAEAGSTGSASSASANANQHYANFTIEELARL